MDLIRHQAQLAAKGLPYGVREVPALKPAAPVVPKVAAKVQAAPATDDDPAKAERLKKREEALARKRAAEGGEAAPAPVAEAAAPAASPAASGEKKKFDKQAMLEKIRQRKAGG